VDLRKYIGPEGAFAVANHVFNAVARKGSTERKELKISNFIKTTEEHRWFDTPLRLTPLNRPLSECGIAVSGNHEFCFRASIRPKEQRCLRQRVGAASR